MFSYSEDVRVNLWIFGKGKHIFWECSFSARKLRYSGSFYLNYKLPVCFSSYTKSICGFIFDLTAFLIPNGQLVHRYIESRLEGLKMDYDYSGTLRGLFVAVRRIMWIMLWIVNECFGNGVKLEATIKAKSHIQLYILLENELKFWGRGKFWESQIWRFYKRWKSCGGSSSPKTKLKFWGRIYIWNPHQQAYPQLYLFHWFSTF